MSNLVHFAHAWARRGYKVFPVKPGEKRPPMIKAWNKNASTDADQIDRWWRGTKANIGVVTDGLLVLDVDVKNNGHDTIKALEKEHGVLPVTYGQTTPTGGEHIFYSLPAGVRVGNSVGKLGPGVDVRGEGGYVLGAGSYIKGSGIYKARGYPDKLAVAPQWLCSLAVGAGEDDQPARHVQDRGDTNESLALAQARAYLRSQQGAYEGGRNHSLYKHACQLKNFGVQLDDAFTLCEQEWNVNNHPPLESPEVKQTVRSAYATSTEGFGTHQAKFSLIAEDDVPTLQELEAIGKVEAKIKESKQAKESEVVGDVEAAVKRMNEKFAYCIMGNRSALLDLQHLERTRDHRFLDKMTARDLTASDKVITSTRKNAREEYAFDVWFEHPERLTYTDVVFDPDDTHQAVSGILNTWRGFPVEPEEGESEGLKLWLEHLHENVAGGNDEHAHWITSFFAHLIQRPWDKPLYALVLLGEKGTGKNAFVERVSQMIRPYGKTDASEARLFSTFNATSENLLLHILDELTWGGNKKTEGQLKSMITETEREIERKFAERYMVKNYTRYVVLSNSDWAVPMTREERRFEVFEVKKGKQQNAAYFERMRRLLDGGENKYLMHYLLNYDTTGVSFSSPLATEAGIRQKVRNSSVAEWWIDDVLHSASLPGMNNWEPGFKFSTRMLMELYLRATKDKHMTLRKFSEELATVRGVGSKSVRVNDAVLKGIEIRSLDEEVAAISESMKGVVNA